MHRLLSAAVAILMSISAPTLADAQADAFLAYYGGDYTKALRLLRPLAEKGDHLTQYTLGKMYEYGEGVPKDAVQAAFWYRKAAEQGNGGAQFNLAFMYFSGLGVSQDFVLAHMWLNLIAAKGDAGAAMYRDSIAAKMTPAQIAEAQKMAREWKPKPSK